MSQLLFAVDATYFAAQALPLSRIRIPDETSSNSSFLLFLCECSVAETIKQQTVSIKIDLVGGRANNCGGDLRYEVER